MSLTKRIFSLLLCGIMLVAACATCVNAASVSVTVNKTGGHNITSGGEVVYSKYSVYGASTKHTEKADVITFNPSNGYIPIVFAKYAGYASRLPDHFATAQSKYGYEVAGVINGSFFDTSNGLLIGMIISNGRIMCGHNAYNSSVVVFGNDGKMNVVDTKIEYSMNLNGTEIKDAIRYINKPFSADSWTVSQFYYYDTSCGSTADSGTEGYEIICKKVQNSDLSVGGTLFAKVLEVKKGQGPSKLETSESVESDKFVLYCRSTSTYAPLVKNLKAGDDITISAEETIAASKEIMENANSVIPNIGWIVKNGVDMTETTTVIGDLNVNTHYRSTVLGIKPDGTYVFLVSDGASTGDSSRSLNTREIASTMIKLGCNNVIRLDGGGSAAMYSTNVDGNGTDGYHAVYNDGGYVRPVSDTILIVKKTTAQDSKVNTALKNAIADAKNYVATTPNATISKYIAEAEAAFAKGAVPEAQARKLYAKLSGKDALKDLLEDAKGISYKDYSEETLTGIRADYDKAVDAYYSETATVSEVAKLSDSLTQSLNQGVYTALSVGKSYTTTATNRNDKYDDDKKKLTDGSKSNKNGKDVNAYAGWTAATKTIDVTVDLGATMNSNTYTVYGASNFWGIKALTNLKVSVSTNGTSFTEVGASASVASQGSGDVIEGNAVALSSITLKTDKAQSARYIRFTVTSPGYVWIDEVEAGFTRAGSETVGEVIEIDGFNQYIYDSNTFIYTPDYGTLTATGINHKYTLNVILESTTDPSEWKIVSKQKCVGSAPNVTLKSNQIMIACHNGATEQSKINDAILNKAVVGDILKLYGINVAEKTMSVAPYAQIKEEAEKPITPPAASGLGDVNNDGAIDQFDYILVKRHYFETRLLTDDELPRADINNDSAIDQFDYILIKRIYFGTYTIG